MLPYGHTCASADSPRPRPSCSRRPRARVRVHLSVRLQLHHAGRLDTNDGRWSIWVVSWVAHALTTDPLQRLPRQHFLSARRRARLFRSEHRRRRGRRAGVAAHAAIPYATHNFVFLVRVRAVLCRHVLPGAPPDRQPACRARSPGVLFAYCPFVFARQAHIQLLLIGLLPWCDAGVAPLHRSHHDRARHRAGRDAVAAGPRVRVLRDLRRRRWSRSAASCSAITRGRWQRLALLGAWWRGARCASH